MRNPLRESALGAFLSVLTLPVCAFEMEMGTLTIDDTFTVPSWTSVSFLDPFDVRPVVFVLPTSQGSDPASARIRNVTTTGFEVLQVEPSSEDGPHVAMNTAYLAIEPGTHVFPDGTRALVQEVSTTAFANRFISVTWQPVAFPVAFASAPAAVAQIQTLANESLSPPSTGSAPFMDVSMRNLTPVSVELTLERAESTAGTVVSAERIGLIAIDDQAAVSFVDALGNAVLLQTLATPNNIVGWSNNCVVNNYAAAFSATPIAVASMTSRDGNNGGWIRRCSESASGIGLTVDEDRDTDSERNHTTESAGVVAASVAFHANFDVELDIAKSFTTISDPVTSNRFSIPGAIVEYRVAVENRGFLAPDNDSLVVADIVPDEMAVCVTAACLAGGPVVLDVSGSPVPPGVSLGTIEYSNDGGSTYSYSPVPDADGFDPVVNAVRITLNGTLSTITTGGIPSFELVMATRIE